MTNSLHGVLKSVTLDCQRIRAPETCQRPRPCRGRSSYPEVPMADAWTEALAAIERANEQAEAEAAYRQARHRAIERERERRDIEALMR